MPEPTDDERRFADYLHRDQGRLPMGTPLAPAITPTSIYALEGEPAGPYQYARWANPGWTELESALGGLEDARAAIFPSGAAAVSSLLASLLKPRDRVLLQSDGYMGTRTAAEKFYASMGVEVETCSTREAAVRAYDGLRLVLLETPSNPGLDLVDIAGCARRAHAAGARLVIDNTLMTPLGQRPLDLGADAVVYSDTKVINGHSDVLFGHVATRDESLLAGVVEWRRVCGAIPGPFEAWMVLRGLETLELRHARMQESALHVARALVAHGGARTVTYPGLPEHPAHALAGRQMRGYGALVGLELADRAQAEAFITSCKYLRHTTSFGGLHSSAERRARWGDPVADGFIRLSVGCEPTRALCADLLQAMDRVTRTR